LGPFQPAASIAWIQRAAASPYFVTEDGSEWHPIGQNDAITWPELGGLFRRRDLAAVESYLAHLASHGVTCLRLMMEYSHREYRYFENRVGRFVPAMVQLWDDLFALCERFGLRILLTPFDTFWMWKRWKRHPYNRANGGPCSERGRLLLCPDTRAAMKARLAFAAERWGGSGALFAWDLWNEIHPAHAENCAANFPCFIEDLSNFLRDVETRLYGRAHPQTVSVFGPHMVLDSRIGDSIFRHPSLDFASTHFYEHGTIDDPKNTVDAAISTGRLMREALAEVRDHRPFFDSESGPIHTFKDRRKTLPNAFDDEYFRHMQWAHFASGGAGGGMRWPNRKPHCLTPGMREAQRGLARFLPLINFRRFRRSNWNAEAIVSDDFAVPFACGDHNQAIVWLLRTDSIGPDGRLRRDVAPRTVRVALPCLGAGRFRVTAWNAQAGAEVTRFEVAQEGPGRFEFNAPPLQNDLAFAVTRLC
jgi:hypothetical protein